MDFDNDSVGGRVIDAPDVPKPISPAELRKRQRLAKEIASAGWVGKPRRWRKRVGRTAVFLALTLFVLSARRLPELSNRLNFQTMGFHIPWKISASSTPPRSVAAQNTPPPQRVVVDDTKINELRSEIHQLRQQVASAKKEMAVEMEKALASRTTMTPPPEPFPKFTVINPYVQLPEKKVAEAPKPKRTPIPAAPPREKVVAEIPKTPQPTPQLPKRVDKPQQVVQATAVAEKPKPRIVAENRVEPRRTPQQPTPVSSRIIGSVPLPPELRKLKGSTKQR